MANNPGSVGFFAAEVLERTARRQPQKTAIIGKDEELTFSTLNRRVHALASHLQADPSAGQRTPGSVAGRRSQTARAS